MVKFLLGLLALVLGGCGPDAADSLPVGFRVIPMADSSRSYHTGTAAVPRPLHALLWYPGSGDGPRLRYRDYLVEIDGGDPLVQYRRRFGSETIPDSSFESLWNRAVPAVRDLAPRPGRAPLVLLASGATAPAYFYSDLAEVLAAAGYAVAVLPSFPDSVGAQFDLDSAGFARQRSDLNHALRVLGSVDHVDTAVTVVGGWSVGGLSAALFGLDHPGSVRGVLSLDGALGYEYAVEPARRLGLEPRCFAEPVLFLTGTRPGQFRVPRTRAIFDHLPGPDAYWAVIPGLNHAQFLSFFSTRAPEAGEREDNDDVVRGTRRLHATIVAFLRGYAGDDQAGWDSLVREEPIESLRADAEFTCPRDAGQG